MTLANEPGNSVMMNKIVNLSEKCKHLSYKEFLLVFGYFCGTSGELDRPLEIGAGLG
jgi:hypothetical protein